MNEVVLSVSTVTFRCAVMHIEPRQAKRRCCKIAITFKSPAGVLSVNACGCPISLSPLRISELTENPRASTHKRRLFSGSLLGITRDARLSRHDSAFRRATHRADAPAFVSHCFLSKGGGWSLANSKPSMDPFSILLAPAFRRHFPSTFSSHVTLNHSLR